MAFGQMQHLYYAKCPKPLRNACNGRQDTFRSRQDTFRCCRAAICHRSIVFVCGYAGVRLRLELIVYGSGVYRCCVVLSALVLVLFARVRSISPTLQIDPPSFEALRLSARC